MALLTNARLMLLAAPGFARVQALAEEGVALGSEEDMPVGQIRWSVEWRVRSTLPPALKNPKPLRRALARQGGRAGPQIRWSSSGGCARARMLRLVWAQGAC